MKWLKLLLPLMLFTSLLMIGNVSASNILVSTNDAYLVGNENYTFNTAMNFTTLLHNSSWIRFDDINFNISSTNDISIVLYSLNSNILTATAGDTIVQFTADTSGGTVYFNISGLDNHTAYQVFRDNVKVNDLTANTSGGISFTGTSWSSHTYVIKEGSNYVKITYEHSGLANVYDRGFSTISLIGTIMVLLAIGVIVTVLMLLKRRT